MSVDRDVLKHQICQAWSGMRGLTEEDANHFLSDEFGEEAPWIAEKVGGKKIEQIDLLTLDYGQQLFPLDVTRSDLQIFLIGAVAFSLLKTQEPSSKRDRLENVFRVMYEKHHDLLSLTQAKVIRDFLSFEIGNPRSSLRDVRL